MRHLLLACFIVGMIMAAVTIMQQLSMCATVGDSRSPSEGDGIEVNEGQPVAREGERSAAEKVNLRLDEKTAEAIAEIVLVKVYGPEVLKQRPWIVATTDTSFKFNGRLKENEVGGVAEIEISKRNAAVILIRHGK
jgi:hypothetical protein